MHQHYHKVIIGIDFNKMFSNKVFIKLTNKAEIHNGFQFQTGLNIDTVKFDPTDECKAGGIYFCEINKFLQWINYNDTCCINYRIVTIPDDAKVYVETDKFKVDKIFLSEKKDIWSNEKMCKIAVAKNSFFLEYVQKRTEELCETENSLVLEMV
jgi:hypothetical protein